MLSELQSPGSCSSYQIAPISLMLPSGSVCEGSPAFMQGEFS